MERSYGFPSNFASKSKKFGQTRAVSSFLMRKFTKKCAKMSLYQAFNAYLLTL
jgi:hypothetical protein